MQNVSVLTQPISLKVFKRGPPHTEKKEGNKRPKLSLFRAMKIIDRLLTSTNFLHSSQGHKNESLFGLSKKK